MSDLTIHEAVDLAERYVTRIATPFVRVRDVLRAAIEADARRQAADTRVAELNATIGSLTGQAEALTLHVEQARQRWATEEQNANQEMGAIREELARVRNEAQVQMAQARAEAAKVKAHAEDATNVRIADLTAQTLAAEAKLEAAKVAYDVFMKKVGGGNEA